MLVPGLVINWWRLRTHRRRFDRRMVTKGFFSMRRELSQARAVQMALFPKLVRWPHLEFDYAYQPANEVGGDFIHASVDEKGRLDVIVLDVTGHGLASALTVARLSGEIERLLAEDPDISPGAVLRALNRYVTLTLAKHSVYLTAVAVQVDPGHGIVRYVNAGHPPAWVRRADGRVERFDSTTFLLGAVADADFDADETTIVLGPLDTMVLVTDGVHEAPDRAGRQFGLERIQEMLSRNPVPDRWCGHLAQIVEQWRGRIGDDDLLVATIRVPSATPPLPPTRSLAEDIEQETVYATQAPGGSSATRGADTATKAGARA
jgi:sigma-B regulation protein RsbU (phosphoserine phosphatase)/two-component system sensor histidine kinase ChiS